jgi:uncharacterized protein (DUF1501 family)
MLGKAYREGRTARTELLADLAQVRHSGAATAATFSGFPSQAVQLASLIAGDNRIRLAFIAVGGWDTHVNQGGPTGRLASRLRSLGEGVAALANGLGTTWSETVIVILSEFGRTVRENGDRGTDHGHGNVIWIAGGKVNGGRIYGEWPGLTQDRLYQHRDLAITTDFRIALAEILRRHMQVGERQLAVVFPNAPLVAPGLAPLLTS